jgi:hypothetical protein
VCVGAGEHKGQVGVDALIASMGCNGTDSSGEWQCVWGQGDPSAPLGVDLQEQPKAAQPQGTGGVGGCVCVGGGGGSKASVLMIKPEICMHNVCINLCVNSWVCSGHIYNHVSIDYLCKRIGVKSTQRVCSEQFRQLSATLPNRGTLCICCWMRACSEQT